MCQIYCVQYLFKTTALRLTTQTGTSAFLAEESGLLVHTQLLLFQQILENRKALVCSTFMLQTA
jgi:hypothetical protein